VNRRGTRIASSLLLFSSFSVVVAFDTLESGEFLLGE